LIHPLSVPGRAVPLQLPIVDAERSNRRPISRALWPSVGDRLAVADGWRLTAAGGGLT